MKLRYETTQQLEEEIDRCCEKYKALLAEAWELDRSAAEHFKLGSHWESRVGMNLQRQAERLRMSANNMRDFRLKKLSQKLAEMRTLPMEPIIGNDISVPLRIA